MRNLEYIKLINFQSWKDNTLQFTPGFNLIVGDSDSGKSSIFRAIKSILTGELPKDFITWGADEAQVELKLGNIKYIRQRNTKTKNIIGFDNKIYERIGNEIPQDYFNSLGITEIELSNGKRISLTMLGQLNNMFFISESDPDKSRIISTICGIDKIDKLILDINRDIDLSKTNLKELLEQQNKQQEEMKQLTTKVNKLKDLKNQITPLLFNIKQQLEKANKFKALKDDYLQNSQQLTEKEKNYKIINS